MSSEEKKTDNDLISSIFGINSKIRVKEAEELIEDCTANIHIPKNPNKGYLDDIKLDIISNPNILYINFANELNEDLDQITENRRSSFNKYLINLLTLSLQEKIKKEKLDNFDESMCTKIKGFNDKLSPSSNDFDIIKNNEVNLGLLQLLSVPIFNLAIITDYKAFLLDSKGGYFDFHESKKGYTKDFRRVGIKIPKRKTTPNRLKNKKNTWICPSTV